MYTRTLGSQTLALPDLDEPGLYLSDIPSLDTARGIAQDFHYAGADLRILDLTGARLLTGKITGLTAARVRCEAVDLHSVEISDSELRNLHWKAGKLSRVVFRNCKIMGGHLADLSLDNVLFDGCKLDYTVFENIRVGGPVAFSQCVLTEATFIDCDLTQAVVRDCGLHLTEFHRGCYQGLDLRESDLASVRGASALKKVVVSPSQQPGLAQALVAELEVVYGEEPGSR